MGKKSSILSIVFLSLILFCSSACVADDYSSYSKEEIEAEISRLEGELEILYRLRDQYDKEPERWGTINANRSNKLIHDNPSQISLRVFTGT